jgi:hypothetical protein
MTSLCQEESKFGLSFEEDAVHSMFFTPDGHLMALGMDDKDVVMGRVTSVPTKER